MLATARRLRSRGSYDKARRRVLKLMPKGSAGCEVGVWKGDFSACILDVTKPRQLHLVDPWKFIPEYKDAWYGGTAARSQDDMDAIYEDVLERFREKIDSGLVRVHRCASSEAIAAIPDGTLDWVYIDGDHTYEHVLADLEGFAAKVRSGGLICGDDYGTTGWWDNGVTRAVDGFLDDKDGFVPVLLAEQFVIRKP